MTWTVPVSDLRGNFADYMARIRLGDDILVKDERRDETFARIVPKKQFNSQAFYQALDQFAGSISAKSHPEWATIKKVDQWLRKIRKASDRRVYVPA